MSKLYPVILSGGAGTRLWPVSTEELPKQFHSFMGEGSLLEQTFSRIQDRSIYEEPIIIGCQAHAQRLFTYKDRAADILLEPCGRNTAPAAAVACLSAQRKSRGNDILIFLPSDHYISDISVFHRTMQMAAQAAEQSYIATIGISPSFPATQYGYIQKGQVFNDKSFLIEKFIEKPDAPRALELLSSGDCLWNSGIFVVKPDVFLKELEIHRPDILEAVKKAFDSSYEEDGVWKMTTELYEAIPSQSIDYALMEHTDKGVVVPSNMGWSDIGTWHSLWEISPQDERGNASHGAVMLEDTKGCYACSSGPEIVLKSVQDLVVVATPESVLVVDREASTDIREIVKRMKGKG